MTAIGNLISSLAAQSTDAWCVVKNSPLTILESSAVLRKQVAGCVPGSDPAADESELLLKDYVRRICSEITTHFQSGDCLPLHKVLGPYHQVRLTTVQLSAETRGFLLFFMERTAVSPADEITRRLQALSPRQSQIIAGLYAGETNRSMSIRMGISEKTVEKHRAKVMGNMQASTSAELIRMITIAQVSGAASHLDLSWPGEPQS